MDARQQWRLILGRLEFLRTAEKQVVWRRVETVSDWQRVGTADLETWLGRPIRARWSHLPVAAWLRADEAYLARSDGFVLALGQAEYPAALAEIADPPFVLWGRGNPLALDRPWVGVVGTRYPTEEARGAARRLAAELAAGDCVVASGLALGIDAAAHRGALECGRTVAVLGQGIDTVAPASHRLLAGRMIAGGGTLLSEYAPGIPAQPYRFPARNRIISGLCRSLVIVQAPQRSGALITADFALDQGRDVLVHAVGLKGERGEGTRALASDGAPVISGAADVWKLWNEPGPAWRGPQLNLEWSEA